MKKTGLGRGLDALLPEVEEEALPENAVVELPIGDIDPNREQPRKRFDEESLRQLAASIAHSGVIQPIIVYPKDGRYVIVAGERRYRASRLAGLTAIPAIVRSYDRVKQMEVALLENIQREDLNPVEEAQAIRRLMDECGLTQEAVSAQLGRSRPAVANLLRILSLPKGMQDKVITGELSAGHARVLAGVEDAAHRQRLFEQALLNGWSVRQLEQAAQKAPEKKKREIALPVELTNLEEDIRVALGVRATISGTPKKGRIVLQYYSQDELETLYEAIERISQKK